MANGDTLVRAKIRLLTAAEGGRTAPIRGSYRPNHNFGSPDSRTMAIGFIEVPEDQEFHPGDTRELSIVFWQSPVLEGQLHPGREWRIQEGAKLVGIGTVIAVGIT